MAGLSLLASKVQVKARNRLDVWMCLRQKWELKLAYERGRSRSSRRSKGVAEPIDRQIVTVGQALRERVLAEYRHKYEGSDYRFLFQIPNGGVGVLWFRDLMQCLKHVGIPCASVQYSDPNFREKWEEFRPNVFISMDLPDILRSLDLGYINEYKSRHGCLRFFTPINKYRFPRPALSREDRWRLEMARTGRSVDAYFSMLDAEFFARFFPEWVNAGFKYLALPNACNPFRHYPVDGIREYDYFMVTTCNPERIRSVHRNLKGVFERYHGLWGGPSWGFGVGSIPPNDLSSFYARAKIAPNPLLNLWTRIAADISERTFSAAACGAFQITNWSPITHKFFAKGELVCAKSGEEFLSAFEHYVNKPDERNAVVLRGMNRVFAEHTYFHRIDKLLSFLDECRDLF